MEPWAVGAPELGWKDTAKANVLRKVGDPFWGLLGPFPVGGGKGPLTKKHL